jgi:hypothetical protein
MPDDLLLAWIGNRGKRCTAGEAAAQTGLPLAAVETQLLALAVEAGGRLQVGENGTIFYSYPPQLRGRLLARSWRRRLLAAARRGVLLMTRLIRLSFGVVLVVVTSLVVMAVMVVLIVRLLNSEKGGNIALSLLQALAQVPGNILQLLVSGLSTGSAGSGTTPTSAPTPAELWHLLWDLPGEGTAAQHTVLNGPVVLRPDRGRKLEVGTGEGGEAHPAGASGAVRAACRQLRRRRVAIALAAPAMGGELHHLTDMGAGQPLGEVGLEIPHGHLLRDYISHGHCCFCDCIR